MEKNIKSDKSPSFGKFSTKEIIFLSISGVLFVVAGYFLKELILGGVSKEPVDYVVPILAIIIFAAFFSVTSALVTARILAWIVLPVVSFSAVLLIPLWPGSYIAAALVAPVLIYALYSTRAAHTNSINFNSSHVIKTCLSGTFTAIVLLMSFYYLHVQLTKPVSIIPTGLLEGVVSFTSGIFGKQLQNQLPLSSEAQGLLGDEGGSLTLENLPPEIQKLIPANLLGILGGSKSTKPSSSSRENEPQNLTQQIANTIQIQIDKLIEPYKPFIPYIFTALFFISVRGSMFILGWFVVPLVSIMLKFLIVIGLVRKEKVQIEAERIFF